MRPLNTKQSNDIKKSHFEQISNKQRQDSFQKEKNPCNIHQDTLKNTNGKQKRAEIEKRKSTILWEETKCPKQNKKRKGKKKKKI